ncbi:MAX gene-associated protein [Tachysurus vachellii]|uniref:MAX gene-associated protein n=1 Tax=Tachysurus vachellii TaxID=175792 RepID=UPI00296A9011|nr:MAX gene-associated protein [Tachysurus vachellii]XP_060722459.1 MAX gene-associated protein [Tachysurus vachellii]
MEGAESDLTLEKKRLTEDACLHTSHSVSVVLKPSKIDECGRNQTNQVTLSSVTLTQSSTQESRMNGDIKVTLENESVWSRFHDLGTEMILTKQGRRMFPCCRFKLSGLDPQRKYFLVMDIMALDDFTYKWNGKTWEPVGLDESHVLGQICVHPESPALGQQWMDSTVSFYKVKLSNDSMDQEGCVRLHPMHRYLPRLRIVPFDPDLGGTIALDSPKVKIFSFPQTAFYAVTSYQNPQITQLKIDCNPFAMAFREDSQSICLLQDKLRPCSSVGTRFRAPLLSLARNFSGKWKEVAVKNSASTRIQDNRERGLSAETESLKEGEGIFSKMKNGILSCPNNTDYSENDRGNDSVYNCTAEPVLDEYMAPLEFEQSDPLEEPLPIADEPFPHISSTENSKSSESFEHAVSSYLGCQDSGSPTKTLMSARSSQTEREIKSVAASLPRPPLNASQVHERKSGHPLKRRRGKKAKSKLWSRAKYKKPPPTVVPLNAPLHPDLEDVEGMLFVSFVAKEALKTPAENTKESETSMLSQSPTHDQSDNHEAEDVNLSVPERIAKLEKILLLHLKQQKHRQVIHPCLQDVGMKLTLLDPKLPIDLQYLGVQLPPLPPLHKGSDKMHPMSLSPSPDGAGLFVSRTGKTNDPTKIKGWKDKFKTNTVRSTTEGLKNSSAFCSEMLDAYLENEAQQISDRVAVFSKCSASPVSYQLPSKSSSYVVTLDSLLKSRSVSSKKDYTKPTEEILLRSPLRGSPNTAIPLSSAGFQHGLQGNRKKGRNFACSLQAQQDALSTLQASKSLISVSRGEIEKQPGKWNVSVSVKARNKMLLQEMEKKAMDLGKVCTHITAERAKFALSSLINFKKSRKRPKYYMHRKNEKECPEDFCRLGCVCDSLGREIRGPTHCRRVECMFDCKCFKHKVLLRRPPKETANVQQGRKSSVLAFSISDPESETRPPPAPSITTLWKRNTGEYDPEPIFIPEPSLSSKKVPYLRTSLNYSFNQVREEDKDPVYLYFESMMTCARVREYNSNPPPQIHMFPTKKEMAEPEELNEIAEAGEPTSSQKARETNSTEIPIKTPEPKPTKLLEILSECNWEPHRNLVLSTLFRRMNSDLLSEPFCFGMYKIQLLSTTIKGVDRSSTITYKVCISRANEKEMTEDLQPPVKKGMKRKSVKGVKTKVSKKCEIRARKATEGSDSLTQQKRFFSKRVFRALPYRTHAAHVGCLKADKKKPGSSTQSLIKVNGKTYSKAKFLLGHIGALHRVNRIAAFVTGRLQHVHRDQTKCVGDVTKTCLPKASLKPSSKTKVTNVSRQTNHAVARPPSASEPEPKNRSSNSSPMNALSQLVGSPPGTTTIVPDGTRFVLVPVTFPNSAAAPSAETVNSSTLPPGQQVVLQPAPGSNFLCQYNGQMIQLKPISTGPLVQPQPSSASEENTSQVMEAPCLQKDTRFLQMPLISTPHSKALLKPLPDISPIALSLSAKSGMNVASGMSAFNLQSSFPGKTGTFSFRICPPTGQGKTVRSEHGGKPPEPSADSPSAVLLPGGFTLIKLLQPAVPAVPANVTSADFLQAEIPQNDENMRKSIVQSCSPSVEQNHQVSENISNPLLAETSNPEHGAPAGLSQSSISLPSEDVNKDEPVEHVSGSVNTLSPGKFNWVPDGAVMVHSSDVSELETEDLDDWPPNGAERILWIDSADEEENEIPPSEEASEPKTTIGANFSSCDERLVDNLQDACSKSSPVDEQKHLKSSISSNGNEKDCDSCINANNSYTANISKQEPSFSVPIKKVANNNPSQILSGSHNISVQFQEDCPSVDIKNEPYNTTDMDKAGNEPGIKDQGLLAEHSTLAISRIETNHQTGENTFLKHVQLMNERLDSANNYGVSTNIESCSDSPRTHTSTMCDVAKQHIVSEDILLLMNKEEPSMNQSVTEFPQDPNKQGLGSKNSSQILTHMEFYNNPSKLNTTASLHAKDIHENADAAGNAQCRLLDSQTLVTSTPTAHPLNTASLVEKTGLQCVSPVPHNKQKLSPELSDGFANLSDNCTKSSKISESNEGKDEALDRNNTAVGELCSDYEIAVDVMNLSEDEVEDEFDRDEPDSIASGETSSDDEDSSNISTSDSETTTDDTMDLSSEDDVDAESFEDNDGKRLINMINVQTRHKHKSRKAVKLKKKIKYLTNLKTSRYLPVHELEKRLNHTEKERIRRDEMRQSFVALKKALNVEERVKMCNHDILNQARLTIWALKDRSQCLEERKKALLQRQSAYLHKIVELSEKTEDGVNTWVQEQCEQQKQIGSQNTLQTSVSGPLVNPQRLDSDGNRLPPSLGCGKAPNYIHKKALRQPPITTTEEQSLPKIALQSFGKTDAVQHTYKTRTSQASSTEVSKSAKQLMDGNLDLNVQTKEIEKCSATRTSCVMEKTLVTENSNKESPAPSSEVTGNDVQIKTLSKLENEQAVVKVRKKIGKNVVVIEETLSSPDVLGPRKLRQRPPAVTGGATRGRTTNKRRRII